MLFIQILLTLASARIFHLHRFACVIHLYLPIKLANIIGKDIPAALICCLQTTTNHIGLILCNVFIPK